MKKKLMVGALALSVTAVLGLSGCGGKEDDKAPETPKYTITFDHDNDSSTSNKVVEFEKGTIVLDESLIPSVPDKDGFAGRWDSFTLNDQDIEVNAVYGDGSESNPYMIYSDAHFQNSYGNKKHETAYGG